MPLTASDNNTRPEKAITTFLASEITRLTALINWVRQHRKNQSRGTYSRISIELVSKVMRCLKVAKMTKLMDLRRTKKTQLSLWASNVTIMSIHLKGLCSTVGSLMQSLMLSKECLTLQSMWAKRTSWRSNLVTRTKGLELRHWQCILLARMSKRCSLLHCSIRARFTSRMRTCLEPSFTWSRWKTKRLVA